VLRLLLLRRLRGGLGSGALFGRRRIRLRGVRLLRRVRGVAGLGLLGLSGVGGGLRGFGGAVPAAAAGQGDHLDRTVVIGLEGRRSAALGLGGVGVRAAAVAGVHQRPVGGELVGAYTELIVQRPDERN